MKLNLLGCLTEPSAKDRSTVNSTTRPKGKQIQGLCPSASLSNRHKRGRLCLSAASSTVPPPTAPAPAQPGGRTTLMAETSRSDYYQPRGLLGERKRLCLETAELPNGSLRNWTDDKGEDLQGKWEHYQIRYDSPFLLSSYKSWVDTAWHPAPPLCGHPQGMLHRVLGKFTKSG